MVQMLARTPAISTEAFWAFSQCPWDRQHFTLGHGHFLPFLLQFTIHYHPIFPQYITRASHSTVRRITENKFFLTAGSNFSGESMDSGNTSWNTQYLSKLLSQSHIIGSYSESVQLDLGRKSRRYKQSILQFPKTLCRQIPQPCPSMGHSRFSHTSSQCSIYNHHRH
jgi:hypothetical protein